MNFWNLLPEEYQQIVIEEFTKSTVYARTELAKFEPEMIEESMREMDEGYLAQDYYRKANYIIPLNGVREERYSFENYSWTEHISRKLGLWQRSSKGIVEAFKKCGFDIPSSTEPDE